VVGLVAHRSGFTVDRQCDVAPAAVAQGMGDLLNGIKSRRCNTCSVDSFRAGHRFLGGQWAAYSWCRVQCRHAYHLHTLLTWMAIAPLLIALGYWAIESRWEGDYVPGLFGVVALSAYCCIAGWRGMNYMLFGPTAALSWRRKKRQRIRVRIERYATGST